MPGIQNFPDDLRPVIVVSGNQDLDQYNSGLCKVVNPLIHSKEGYPVDQLNFIGGLISTTQKAIEENNKAPEYGTVCLSKSETGLPGTETIIGVFKQVNNPSSQPGNNPVAKWLEWAIQQSTGKKVKPNIREIINKGAKVREANEKNQEWKHALTAGLNISVTDPPILGQYVPEIRQIATAIQNFAEIPTSGILSQLPGSIMNLASLLNNMSNSQKSQATKNMPSEVATAFNSMSTLLTSTSTNGSNVTSDRIHEETFMNNAVDLLSQVTNLSDLITVMQRLHEDESIRGLENFAKQAETGLTATVIDDNVSDVSYLLLDKDVSKSTIYFTQGYSINVNNQMHVVVSANQDSNLITVLPEVKYSFVNERVKVYLPVVEYQTEGPYGSMTMQMDMNGNIKPNKQSAQKIASAIQSLISLMNSAQAGGKGQNLFGPAADLLSKSIQRIPNNIRAQLINEVASKAKTLFDPSVKKLLNGQYPGV